MTMPGPGLHRAARLGLAAMAVAVLVIANDFTALSYARLGPKRIVCAGAAFLSVGMYPSRASLAGGIVYMFQIGGGSIGLGLNTAIVDSSNALAVGIGNAFRVDAILAICGLLVAALFVGGDVDLERLAGLRHHHRAHA